MTILAVLAIFCIGLATFNLICRRLQKAAQRHNAAPSPAPASTPFRTLLLVTPSDEALTDTAKSVLIDTWGDLPVSELTSKSVIDLAFEFQATFPSPQYDDQTRLRIAESVHAVLHGTPTQPTPEPKPVAKAPTAESISQTRKELQELAAPVRRITGSSENVSGGIYMDLYLTACSGNVHDVIVLHRCVITGCSGSGRIFTAPGVPVAIEGSSGSIKVVQMPWSYLAKQAEKQWKSPR
jgi:hypothetical protein